MKKEIIQKRVRPLVPKNKAWMNKLMKKKNLYIPMI